MKLHLKLMLFFMCMCFISELICIRMHYLNIAYMPISKTIDVSTRLLKQRMGPLIRFA